MSKHKRLRRLAAISRDESVTVKELAELIRKRIQYAEDLADTRLRKLRELEERFTKLKRACNQIRPYLPL